MTLAYALLLDGGFLRYKLGKPGLQVDAAGISAFSAQVATLSCLQGMRLHRVYFYDSRPLHTVEHKPWGGGPIDFGTSDAAARSKDLHASLMKERYFALRFGELQLEGWRLRPRVLRKAGPVVQLDASDLEPNIRQKGVDMRIGLDIASLTLKKQFPSAVISYPPSRRLPA